MALTSSVTTSEVPTPSGRAVAALTAHSSQPRLPPTLSSSAPSSLAPSTSLSPALTLPHDVVPSNVRIASLESALSETAAALDKESAAMASLQEHVNVLQKHVAEQERTNKDLTEQRDALLISQAAQVKAPDEDTMERIETLKRQREQKSEECARLKRLRKASESTHAKNRAAIVRVHKIEADIRELQARFSYDLGKHLDALNGVKLCNFEADKPGCSQDHTEPEA